MYNYSLLPEHIRGGVRRYIEGGVKPGHFLQAVICNDLRESFARADDTNIARMFDIVCFFYNEAPQNCWGSEEKMLRWMKRKEDERKSFKDRAEELVHKDCGGKIVEHPTKRYKSDDGLFPAYFCERCDLEIIGDAQTKFRGKRGGQS